MRRIPIVPRADWQAQAGRLGFHFHTIDGEPYWDESAYYAFTLRQVEDDIEAATDAVHGMAMALVEDVVGSEELLARLAIPASHWDWIRDSWQRQDPHLYGRMDFAYDGSGPAKLYELNYDTPTSLYEAAYFQWLWLEQQLAAGQLPAGADQYNRIQEHLCEALATLAQQQRLASPMHFSAVRDSIEDRGTVRYLQDCAEQAGIETRYVAIEDIGISAEGWFTDQQDYVIRTLFKLYPLEFMMVETFGANLDGERIQLLEPAWKAILSNKGILPLLWERHPHHPNLLEARFDDAGAALPRGWVRKPMHSREGANIELFTADGTRLKSDGPYDDGPTVLQAHHPLPVFDGHYPLVGSWVIAGQAAGMGLREDATPITRDTSRFVPHAILD
ncbi:MAG: glutathionylspermidine synthase family protein [Lysobacter sp.]|nr:glutathionylspermidine synthase family protein [Lysobacter sp.]